MIVEHVSQDPLAGLGQPVPAMTATPEAPEPTWEPPNMYIDPQPDLEIRHELEERVLKAAGVAAPTTSRCEFPAGFSGGKAAQFSCTVTYGKLAVPYQVTTEPKGGLIFSWTAESTQTVVTRAGILATVASSYSADKEPRCDELPEAALVEIGKKLPQQCYARIEGQYKTVWIDMVPGPTYVGLQTRFQ
ncbi:hypothetical protein [Actinoplanes couchii]|uniref:DUF4333 domain-containing protein n=1 Tax=Actinoplanes couchii TaxID=403638 RepID=A0ABQ3XN33_9ACTN|nr:hypothetical protein [Actinoplanes couchii]MDR6317898.1 hypothetical protein [Actinoplanes couchii]GID59885.1 hypothetical protein Aco03nite_082890 [Actinoplanes couchii]